MINFINNPNSNTNTNSNSNKCNKFLNGTKIASNRIKVPVPLSQQPSINTEGDTVFERFSYRNINSEVDISNKRNTNIISNDNTTNDLTNELVFENKKQDQPISSSTYLYKIQQRASRQ